MSISFKKTFYILASIIAFVFMLDIGQEIIIPIAFALLFSFILYPLVKWMKSKGLNAVTSIFISLGSVVLTVVGILFLFSAQIIRISKEYTSFLEKLRSVFDASIKFLNNKIQVLPDMKSQSVLDRLTQFFSESGFVIVSDTINVTTTFFSYLILTIIYTFLILLYSKHLSNAIVSFSPRRYKKKYREMLKEVQKIGMTYLIGMVTLIVILGILNSIGLLIIGLDYAFFFGFLAALLAVIPYVGTILGGLIPTVYALVTYDSYGYALGVILIFWIVQFLEGNYLSPKIVGGSLNINPLFSIISLIAGGFLWGIPGMILFLPIVAILKVISSYFKELEPFALLLSDDQEEDESSFEPFSRIKEFITKKFK